MPFEPSQSLEAARSLDASGRREEAAAAYVAYLEASSESVEGWVEYAGLLLVLGRLEQARKASEMALRLDPRHYGALVHSAGVQLHLGHLEKSEQFYREAIALEPMRLSGLLMFSDCLAQKGDLTQARTLLESVLAREPENGIALDRRNTILARQGDWPTLRKDMERQLLRYSGAEAEYVASHLDLMFGDMHQGWARFESRLDLPGRSPQTRHQKPQWNGGSFVGNTLLLTWEQGFGDTLMFLRFAAMAKALGGRVLLEVQPPLVALAATCSGIDLVLCPGQELPPFDFHASLLSLPALLGTRLDSIPAHCPYLNVPDAVPGLEQIDKLLGASQNQVRVGVCWAGNASHVRDAKRSLPASALAPLGSIPGIAWFDFQLRKVDMPPLPGIVDLGPILDEGGFATTAYALRQMDLVITVDTVLAHLAGALGIPTLLLLSFIPDWRWMLGRADSPWYPTVRLYRQPAPGDWASVLQQVVRDLNAPDS